MKILTIDGGGVRGVLPSEIINRLTRSCPGWIDRIDLFADLSSPAKRKRAAAA